MNKIDKIIEKYKNENSTIISLLQDITDEYGYLPEDVLNDVSKKVNVPLSKLYGLATFYTSFRLTPKGKNHICVCVGTACHVKGATKLLDVVEIELNIKDGETTENKGFSMETVNCLGACALSPLIVVNGKYHVKLDQNKVKKIINKIKTDEA